MNTNFHISTHDQGDKVKPTKLVASTASTPTIGRFALLRSLLHLRGTGAPEISMTARRLIPALAPALCLLVLAALPAVAAAEACPNENLRVENDSTELPDCRAFERVSPVFTNTGEPKVATAGLGPSGSTAMLEISKGSVEGLEGFINAGFPVSLAKASRTAAGWTTVGEALPTSEYEAADATQFGSKIGLEAQTNVFSGRRTTEPSNRLNLYLRRSDRSIAEVGPALPPTAEIASANHLAERNRLKVEGSSSDMSHLLFSLNAGFWPFDDTEEQNIGGIGIQTLYEYVGIGNTRPMLVGVSDGSTIVLGEDGGQPLPAGQLISDCGTDAGSKEYSQNAISSDGNTVFFTAQAKASLKSSVKCTRSAPPVDELFARIDNSEAAARTVAISQPSEADCSACYANKQLISAGQLADANFIGASEDGSKVFFTTQQPLLGSDTSGNLYEYDFDAPAGERLVRASAGDGTAASSAAGVAVHIKEFEEIRPVISADGSHVYFCATGVLTRTPNGEGESAEAGASNLYVFERDASYPQGRIAFVAQLALGTSVESPVVPEIQTTPDGRFLVFTSRRDLTPDDTTAAQQVFEYDAQTGELTRVSIGEHGYNHNGNAPLEIREEAGFTQAFSIDDATLPHVGVEHEYAGTTNQEQYEGKEGFVSGPNSYSSYLSVSAEGAYVFFQSSVALTPLAQNEAVIGHTQGEPVVGSGVFVSHAVYAQNVYEYHDGRVSLIADGDMELVGTDPSAQDLFLRSTRQLVPQGPENTAVFDARVDGGFPAPVGPPSCSGEDCQGALSGAPTLLSPGSEFQAGGNPPLAAAPITPTTAKPKAKAKGCKKGYVKQKSKCVKKRAVRKAKKAGADRRAK
jgi:hypothetical protein